jgi:hypothetical protein
LLRQPLLDFVVRKAKEKFKEKFDVDLKIRDAGFTGIRDIYFSDVFFSAPQMVIRCLR